MLIKYSKNGRLIGVAWYMTLLQESSVKRVHSWTVIVVFTVAVVIEMQETAMAQLLRCLTFHPAIVGFSTIGTRMGRWWHQEGHVAKIARIYQKSPTLHVDTSEPLYQVQQKSNPLKLFAVFSAGTWHFSVEFYKFMWLFYVSLTAKRHLIIFKYDEATDILASPLWYFHTLKNVSSETQQKSFYIFLLYLVWKVR